MSIKQGGVGYNSWRGISSRAHCVDLASLRNMQWIWKLSAQMRVEKKTGLELDSLVFLN